MINAKYVEVRKNGVTHSQSQFYYHKISTQNQSYAFTISDEGVLLPQNTLKYTKVGHSHSQMKKFYYHKTLIWDHKNNRRSTQKWDIHILLWRSFITTKYAQVHIKGNAFTLWWKSVIIWHRKTDCLEPKLQPLYNTNDRIKAETRVSKTTALYPNKLAYEPSHQDLHCFITKTCLYNFDPLKPPFI